MQQVLFSQYLTTCGANRIDYSLFNNKQNKKIKKRTQKCKSEQKNFWMCIFKVHLYSMIWVIEHFLTG